MKNPAARRGVFARIARREARPSALAETITDQSVRSMYGRLVDCLGSLPGSVRVQESNVDLRAEFGKHVLCRVVPYRELLHIQVGAEPIWEIRVRDRAAYAGAVDRIFREFLRLVATTASSAPGDEDRPV